MMFRKMKRQKSSFLELYRESDVFFITLVINTSNTSFVSTKNRIRSEIGKLYHQWREGETELRKHGSRVLAKSIDKNMENFKFNCQSKQVIFCFFDDVPFLRLVLIHKSWITHLSLSLSINLYTSSPKSCLTLEKSKSSPVPRLNKFKTSIQVVSKCEVASNDSEMNTWLDEPSSVGL